MFFVYVLWSSKLRKRYVGSTGNGIVGSNPTLSAERSTNLCEQQGSVSSCTFVDNHAMKPRFPSLSFVFLFILSSFGLARSGVVHVITVDATINPATADYIHQ